MSSSTYPPPRRGTITGSTKNTMDNSAMLGAEFWQPGQEVLCLYNREFATKYGVGHEFLLVKPVAILVRVDEFGHASPSEEDSPESRRLTRFAMPPLAGFDMAYQDLKANGFDGFRHGDRCMIRCTEVQRADPGSDFSDMPMFEISVDAR